ncbi:MAG: 5-deoxy-glucuronate isomerase [Oscillospiraceae bacterium]|nr:5-deoxy-glucuronate isomerase [Oscillospiraceae bacterium]
MSGEDVGAIRRANGGHPYGVTVIAGIHGAQSDMGMDFEVARLKRGGRLDESPPLEKAILLVYGRVRLTWNGESAEVERAGCFDAPPYALRVPDGVGVTIEALAEDTELAVVRAENGRGFPPRLYLPRDTPDEYRGAGLMGGTSTRIVRTIFDYSNAPDASLVLGEVIGFPGKWSSYPPHHHPQPEIYYYKTNPEGGFGYAELGERVYKVRRNDALFIREGQTHPHCAAPGYALWYLWAIRHLPGNPYTTPIFLPEHRWTLDKDATFWGKGGAGDGTRSADDGAGAGEVPGRAVCGA